MWHRWLQLSFICIAYCNTKCEESLVPPCPCLKRRWQSSIPLLCEPLTDMPTLQRFQIVGPCWFLWAGYGAQMQASTFFASMWERYCHSVPTTFAKSQGLCHLLSPFHMLIPFPLLFSVFFQHFKDIFLPPFVFLLRVWKWNPFYWVLGTCLV